MKQHVICITGFHRSGTSMLTWLLHHCGLALGPEKDMAAYSTRRRNGTSYTLGLRLWEIYNRRLLAASSQPRSASKPNQSHRLSL